VLPLFVKNTFNWSSTAAGLIFITVMVPGFFSPLVGMVSDRYGAKWPALAGFVASIPLFVCLRFVTENTLTDKALLCVLLSLLGFTMAFSTTPLMAEITYAIDDREREQPGIWGEKGVYGIAYGLFTTAFALGGTVGSIMSGEIVATAGWATMTWAIAVWYVAAIPVVWLWVGSKPCKQGVPADTEQGAGANGPASSPGE
jgi:MFS family permease